MKNKKISFLLSKVSEDGVKEEPQIVPVDDILSENQTLNRRGFLGAGLVASASLLFLDSCAIGKNSGNSCDIGRAHKTSIKSLMFSQDGRTLISQDSSLRNIKFWKVPEGALIKTLNDLGNVRCIEEAPNGNILVFIIEDAKGNTKSNTSYWNLSYDGNKSKLLDVTENTNGEIMTFSPNGKIIARSTNKGTIEIRDVQTGNINKILYAHNSIHFLKFSPDGKFLISIENSDSPSKHRNLNVWEITDYKIVCSILDPGNGSKINGLCILPDGKSFITLSGSGEIKQWSLPYGNLLKSEKNKNSRSISCLTGDQQGRLLATVSENLTINLWNLPDLSPQGKLTGHTSSIYSMAISPDGKLLASGSEDGRIRLWKLPEGTSLPCPMDLECSPSSVKGNRYTTINEYGETVTYTMPCGSPLPRGAKCICNCVPGSIKPSPPVRRSWSHCSCYPQICTCVPVYR